MALLYLAAAVIAGVFLASRLEAPVTALALLALASALVTALLASLRRPFLPGLLLMALFLGATRVEAFESNQSPALTAYHSKRPVKVEGVIVSDPESVRAATRFRFRVEMVRERGQWSAVSGDALVTLRESSELVRLRDRPYFRYGDRLLLEGRLESPPELDDFDYPAYLARQGIHTVMTFPKAALIEDGQGSPLYQWLYAARRRIADSIASVVPEPQASLGQALLLGLRDNLPGELVEDFQKTGTSHVLAISGLHVGILLGITLTVSRWAVGRHRRWHLMAPLSAMWLYALVSGMSPSVVRAAIMGSIYLLALLLGRPRSVLPALGFAAAVMVAVTPGVLWSVSFQLSFAAMAGLAALAEPIGRGIEGALGVEHEEASGLVPLRAIIGMVAVTLAATIATLPIVAFYFHRVSLIGVPASLVVLPALPFVLVGQAVAAGAGLVSDTLAQPLGWLAWATTWYVTTTVRLLARWPGASVELGSLAPVLVWLYYALLGLVVLRGDLGRTGRRWLEALRARAASAPSPVASVPPWAAVVALVVAALVWTAALWPREDRLRVYFVDVGQGDAIFISAPGGVQAVVDGGPDPLAMARFIGETMPFGDSTIELMVLSHGHSDHVTGLLEVLRRYDVGLVMEREVAYDAPPYQAWRKALEGKGVQVVQAQAGQVVTVGELALHVLHPGERLLRGTASDVDNASVALRLVYGDVGFLLTGDMFAEAEAALVRSGVNIDSDVLKVGHHGSRSSSTPAFLEAVSPAVAVISAGQDNSFDHPHPETIAALKQHVQEQLIFVTSQHGTIGVATDGRVLEVRTSR